MSVQYQTHQTNIKNIFKCIVFQWNVCILQYNFHLNAITNNFVQSYHLMFVIPFEFGKSQQCFRRYSQQKVIDSMIYAIHCSLLFLPNQSRNSWNNNHGMVFHNWNGTGIDKCRFKKLFLPIWRSEHLFFKAQHFRVFFVFFLFSKILFWLLKFHSPYGNYSPNEKMYIWGKFDEHMVHAFWPTWEIPSILWYFPKMYMWHLHKGSTK